MTEWDQKKTAEASDSARKREMDEFWDVEKLLPARPARRVPPPRRETPSAVEVELSPRRDAPRGEDSPAENPPVGGARPVAASPLTVTGASVRAAAGQSSEATHYVPPHKKNETSHLPLVEYTPVGVLLHRVRVYDWQAGYHYFDGFVEEALRFDAKKPPKTAEKASFFSYFPQYSQLSPRAEAWYLYWREYVRQGQYPDTDYAYILLYLFELINLPVATPAEGRARRDAMAKVWMAYRKAHPQLDHYMCEWLCDYCLIHELTAPVDLLSPALDAIIGEARLKEFYLSAAVRLPEGEGQAAADTAMATAGILMRHCCQYDYRKSKFAQGEHKKLFDTTIPAAVAHILPLLLGGGSHGRPAVTMLDSTVTRDAFVGALCSYRNKRRIEVEYTSFSRSHELRFLMGDMVKHVENRLRSWIGVRSRLSVMALPIPLRDALDAYLAPLEPTKVAAPVKKKEVERPAYEALYDLPRKTLSARDAAAIEAESWETTRILVEAFGDTQGANDVAAEAANEVAQSASDVPLRGNDDAPATQTEENGGNGERGNILPLAPYAPFIKAALEGDAAALRAAARGLGKMPDALADEINAITADGEIGDIILEEDGMGGYTVIEDYRRQVADLLCM
ncbi:MAG: TerB N-terminal domain-containing protein [Clostridia bacterium]|nr:TerB N-terminal domain-containing protein [Clostridia bacterium]